MYQLQKQCYFPLIYVQQLLDHYFLKIEYGQCIVKLKMFLVMFVTLLIRDSIVYSITFW